jgi:hypothetical protein
MKFLAVALFFTGFVVLANGHEKSSDKGAVGGIGLAVGQKAPAFAARDQFGHEQSNETLKGSNGTVLLFFRSADW